MRWDPIVCLDSVMSLIVRKWVLMNSKQLRDCHCLMLLLQHLGTCALFTTMSSLISSLLFLFLFPHSLPFFLFSSFFSLFPLPEMKSESKRISIQMFSRGHFALSSAQFRLFQFTLVYFNKLLGNASSKINDWPAMGHTGVATKEDVLPGNGSARRGSDQACVTVTRAATGSGTV